MTIRQRGKEGICESQFWVDGTFYQFTFNGKNDRPLITSKKKAREKEYELKREIRMGTNLKDSELKNFAKFFDEIYMDYSRKHKEALSSAFDEQFGKRLVEEFGNKSLSQITPRMIENYLVTLLRTNTRFEKPHSPVTVRRHYNMLNQLFNMAHRERLVNDNPCRSVSRAVLKQLPTWRNRERWLNKYEPDEEERLFAAFNQYGGHLAAITRIVMNTGIRPPKEVLAIKKRHINLSNEARYCRVEQGDVLIPPQAILVAKGKDGKPRVLPLNQIAQRVFSVLVNDRTTGEWLFTNRDGRPVQSIKKGFASACERAKIEDLRSYDLRHTFATRLLERGVHHFVISALLGHATPMTGFGYASRMTPGYAHATWEAMVEAVKSLEKPVMNTAGASEVDQSETELLKKAS
ncbi:MAG TPA: tyrosine-type recombinase/integrase [Pyrinomonadaceae bacterium]|nr:tyrosine-type recombinase/integrase [Pyrinomonadaceae bacterium]